MKRKREGNKFRDKENLSLERANGVMVVGWGSEVKKKQRNYARNGGINGKVFCNFIRNGERVPHVKNGRANEASIVKSRRKESQAKGTETEPKQHNP